MREDGARRDLVDDWMRARAPQDGFDDERARSIIARIVLGAPPLADETPFETAWRERVTPNVKDAMAKGYTIDI